VIGLVVGACGLFVLPQLGLGAAPAIGVLAHGFPAWDEALLGASGHGNALFYSALVPLALAALFYGLRRARGLVAGFALGVAGHLVAQLLFPTVAIHGAPLGHAWLAGNALLAVAIGSLVARP
jgi:hypothetical protein